MPVAAEVREALEPFLDQHCYACHDDFDQEGDLNLLDLEFDPSDPENRKIWELVFQRVEQGEMPPKKKKRPQSEALGKFLAHLEQPLTRSDQAELQQSGRVHGRRLTREEYQYTIHDLLGVDLPLGEYLTPESNEGFTNNAERQQTSHFHLDGYLRAAAVALDEAFNRALEGEAVFQKTYPPKVLAQRRGKGNPRGPQLWKDKAIAWNEGVQFYGRMNPTKVPASGWYEIRISDVKAINPGPDGVIWGDLKSGYGHSSEPLLFEVGLIEATQKPKDKVFTTWIREGHILLLRPNESGLRRLRLSDGGTVQYGRRDLGKEGYPGIEFGSIGIRRVFPNANRGQVQKNLFGHLTTPRSGGKTPSAELHRLIERFANLAFRRPVKAAEIQAYFKLGEKKLKETENFPAALKTAYHALLTSPHFLTFVEKPGPLSDHALASRLSYFLWKSMPDSRLRKLADERKLRDSVVLRNETNRLLADKKSARFLKSFTDQWLQLSEIDATQPDPKRFRSFDPVLQRSMVEETRAFINELIRTDGSVRNFLKSDFAFLNTRLQKHYHLIGLPVKAGEGMQKITLKPAQRSGLLTQSSILKVTADGSVTSPVLRGVWVNERILGRHIPPPPPNIPAVEPDIRGAVSIRDQLAKHSKLSSCAGCHAKIDPSGFSLENYDPIGNYRVRYGKKKSSAKVDPSGETPDGSKFDNYLGWRAVYLNNPEVLARAFSKQILEYSTGGHLRFSDREALEHIVSWSGKGERDYGLKSIIRACVASPIFQQK